MAEVPESYILWPSRDHELCDTKFSELFSVSWKQRLHAALVAHPYPVILTEMYAEFIACDG